jgi:hypothetical protein
VYSLQYYFVYDVICGDVRVCTTTKTYFGSDSRNQTVDVLDYVFETFLVLNLWTIIELDEWTALRATAMCLWQFRDAFPAKVYNLEWVKTELFGPEENTVVKCRPADDQYVRMILSALN